MCWSCRFLPWPPRYHIVWRDIHSLESGSNLDLWGTAYHQIEGLARVPASLLLVFLPHIDLVERDEASPLKFSKRHIQKPLAWSCYRVLTRRADDGDANWG